MKKLIIFAMIVAALASSQSLYAQQDASTQSVDLSATTLRVRMVEEMTVVKRGPYARFAQQSIGVVAPLTDRVGYRILSASVVRPEAGAENAAPVPENNISIYSNVRSDTTFTRLPFDRSSAGTLSQEEMAAQAASALFTLRKRRFDLVTGEAGENVYGEGMKAALDEMRAMEEEYAALFLGKSYTVCTVREFDVAPAARRNNAIVCRFTEARGILPETDLSGRPVVLELVPQSRPSVPETAQRGSRTDQPIYSPAPTAAQCRITEGDRVLFEGIVTVYL